MTEREANSVFSFLKNPKKMNYKKISTGIAATLVVAAFLAACSEKVEVGGNDSADGIGIGVTVRQHWHETSPKKSAAQATRATQTSNNMATQVIQAEGTIGNEPVYLWCDEIKGIDGKGLSVEVEAAQDEATRGTLKSGIKNGNEFDPETFYDKFSIYGEKAHGGRLATWRHDNEWTLSSPFAWGDDHDFKFAFYGIAPVGAEGLSESDIHEHFRFTYNTPRNATKQSDIMVGLAEAKHSDRHIWFKFRHVLTAIKFKVGGFKSGYKITRVELEGIYKTNTYNLEDSTWNAFTGSEAKFDETSTAFSTVPGDGLSTEHSNHMITSDSEGTTFIVLPQTVPANAWAIITLVPDGSTTPEYIRASISGIEWQEGYTYTYTISSSAYPSDYHLEVDGAPEFKYTGAIEDGKTNTYNIKSYKKEKNGDLTPKEWEIVGYMVTEDEGNWPTTWETEVPEMLTSISNTSGEGSTDVFETGTVAVTEGDIKQTQRRQNELRDKNREVKENFDLSLYRIDNHTPWAANVEDGRTTANCYIVRYAGTYKIPLVIGNCYQWGSIVVPNSGTDEEGSITVDGQEFKYSYGPGAFVDYNGANFKEGGANPIIKNAKSAKMVWHDFEDVKSKKPLDVIKNYKVTTEADANNLYYLTFTVDRNLIQQGNAVLAVMDEEGRVIWSWHIYITDRNWMHDVTMLTNYQGVEYFIANYNLGYVEKRMKGQFNYKKRWMRVLVRQPESGLEDFFTITQNDGNGENQFNFDWDTKYQWGRKDALPGASDNGSIAYSSQSIPITKFYGDYVKTTGRADRKVSIQQPGTRYAGDNKGRWETTDKVYVNAWSENNTKLVSNRSSEHPSGDQCDNSPVKKTIYDPCPPGFCMPPSGAFTGFTLTGQNGGTRNMKGSVDDDGNGNGRGYTFYSYGKSGATDAQRKSSPTVFFPFVGRRLSGDLSNWGTNSWIWTATIGVPYNNSDPNTHVKFCSYHLSMNGSSVNVLYANTLTSTQSVRPMEDPSMHDHIDHEDSDIRPYDNKDDENLRLNN